MSPGKHEECEKCGEHLAWEEKMKMLDKIPGLLSWMNFSKGGIAVIVVLIPIVTTVLTTMIITNRSEMITRIKETEALVAKKQDRMEDQVRIIGENTSAIRQSVAVMKNTFEMFREQSIVEHASLRKQNETTGTKTYISPRDDKGNR